LCCPTGEVNDPAVFVTPVPNYDAGEVLVLGDGERLRILEIAPAIVDELAEFGIGSVFTVEPV
jgi:hypothetical protein